MLCYKAKLTCFLKVSHKAYACVVTTAGIIKIVDKSPLGLVLEEDPHHAETAGKCRMLFFNDLTPSPVRIAEMLDNIAYLEVKPYSHVLV